jgi:uncharacterized membrane protein
LNKITASRGFMTIARLSPSDPQIRKVRQYLHAELALFVFLPIFAAAMARG